MDRLRTKLEQAAGVNARVSKAIEDDADALIARESEILNRKTAAFAPHHQALDERSKELDRFEDSLQIVENAASPLKSIGDSEQQNLVDKMLEDAVAKAVEAPASH